MGARIGAISEFVKNYDGLEFFEKFSTDHDSILKFLKKIENKQNLF